MAIQLPDFSLAKILVYGDVMLDRYWQGATSRISPEAPVPVVHVKDADDRPGGAGNVALNIASLGGDVQLFAPCGVDEAGQILEKKLQGAGIKTALQRSYDRPTVLKLRVLSGHQQMLRLDFEETEPQDHSLLQQQCIAQLVQANCLILSDYNKGALQDPQPLIKAAKGLNIPVIVDPKGSDFSKYRGATLLTPNFKEFVHVVGECDREAVILQRGMDLIEACELTALLLTRGAKGMMLIQPGQPILHLPARSSEVFDVTGAGDTVVATLAASLGAGQSFEEGTKLANIAAGHVVSKLGAAQITVSDMQQCLDDEGRCYATVLNQSQLQRCLETALGDGDKVTIIQGGFDSLGVRDIQLFAGAKAMGERLIIVTPEKADANDMHSISRRHTVLAGLEAVDWIVSCAETQFEAILKTICPDKGEIVTEQGFLWMSHLNGNLKLLKDFWVSDWSSVREKVARSQDAIIVE